jgi:hypothetical protein
LPQREAAAPGVLRDRSRREKNIHISTYAPSLMRLTETKKMLRAFAEDLRFFEEMPFVWQVRKPTPRLRFFGKTPRFGCSLTIR